MKIPFFINENFLLESDTANTLYYDFASKLPIIDYHCHLSTKAIANNYQFENITQLWIEGDHYKWRAMRNLGIKENFISGNASDSEKFYQFAKAVPYTMRNPIYHWSHLELNRYFNCNELLSEKNADRIYHETTNQVQSKEFKTQSLLKKMNVELVCTTEDPIDTLKYHQQIANSNFDIKISTSFRPDKAILIQLGDYNSYIDSLAEASNCSIDSYNDLKAALQNRINYFHENGCRLSDHGLNYIPFEQATEKTIARIFKKRRQGNALTQLENIQFQTALMVFLGILYHDKGWVQQFHLGAMRNNNTRMYNNLGPDTGWDSIGNYPIAQNLSCYLDHLDKSNQLAKTIIYNLNPSDNAILASMIGNFNDGSLKGKIQWGSGWWFMDQLEGMTNQINTLSSIGLISCFIGMLTDSRSFLSFPRHEYFRRLLCNLFGNDIEKGLLPNDLPWVGKIISDICYYNAKEYFDY
jgi:glucuronate isomerase